MSKLRILYIVSLLILLVLSVRVLVWPMIAWDRKYSEVYREGLLQTKDGWILKFDVVNREGNDAKYTVNVSIADEQYTDEFLIQDGGTFTYVHHILRDRVGTGEVSFCIYKEGAPAALEGATYYLR